MLVSRQLFHAPFSTLACLFECTLAKTYGASITMRRYYCDAGVAIQQERARLRTGLNEYLLWARS